MMNSPRSAGHWGKARPIHKYLRRDWNVSRQDWDYMYPESPEMVGGGMMAGEDPEDAIRRTAAGHELDYRREAQAASDLESETAGEKQHGGEEGKAEADESKDPKYLHGFEEGYELGKRVEAAEEGGKE